MAATVTDGWIVTQHGKVLAEFYYGGMHADTSHLLMSVSKSLIAMVVGALVSSGALERRRGTDATTCPPSPTPDTRVRRCAICSTCVRG